MWVADGEGMDRWMDGCTCGRVDGHQCSWRDDGAWTAEAGTLGRATSHPQGCDLLGTSLLRPSLGS